MCCGSMVTKLMTYIEGRAGALVLHVQHSAIKQHSTNVVTELKVKY